MTGLSAPVRMLILGLAFTASVCAPFVASAQMASTPSAVNETQGATTGLGTSHRFASAAAAADHCANEVIVWSSGPDLTYEVSGAANYGKGHGFYACKDEADDAGFHAAGN